MYLRFISEERRNRRLQKWNNLKFSDFLTENSNRYDVLRRMCSMASSMQQQLGGSYQDNQHLRNALLSACKNENWSYRLATMNTSSLLDIEKSLAKAITAEESIKHGNQEI